VRHDVDGRDANEEAAGPRRRRLRMGTLGARAATQLGDGGRSSRGSSTAKGECSSLLGDGHTWRSCGEQGVRGLNCGDAAR
jgi:hypothetical protein